MTTASARGQRGIVEECLKWVSQRKAFGKPLASQAVVRSKIAAMIARVESVQSWLENITHQMNNMVRLLQFELWSRRAKRRKIVVQGTSEVPRWTNRPTKDVRYSNGTRHCTGCCTDFRWTWNHADGDGPLH
jgi:hypothetical protein